MKKWDKNVIIKTSPQIKELFSSLTVTRFVMHRKAKLPAALPQLPSGAFIVKMSRGIVLAESLPEKIK